jgi:preprotein translocase subunit SecD
MELLPTNLFAEFFRALALLIGAMSGAPSGTPPADLPATANAPLVMSDPQTGDTFTTARPFTFGRDTGQGGGPALLLELSGPDRRALAKFTANHTGKTVEISVCDTVVSSPMIMSPITGGGLLLSSGGGNGHTGLYRMLRDGCP